jgi:pilus assembly protein Flp/PilA
MIGPELPQTLRSQKEPAEPAKEVSRMLEMYLRLKNQLDVAREEGQGLVEYALIIVLVSIAAIALLTTMGTTIGSVFSHITADL